MILSEGDNPPSQSLWYNKYVSRSVEYYPTIIITTIQLAFLLKRYWDLKRAGHISQTRYPYSIKVKQLLLLIWFFIACTQVIMVVFSSSSTNFWVR